MPKNRKHLKNALSVKRRLKWKPLSVDFVEQMYHKLLKRESNIQDTLKVVDAKSAKNGEVI